MYYQLPLEQLARRTDGRPQIDFAREALALLDESDDVRFKPTPRGLALYGADEASLARPAAVLADRYGPEVQLRTPRVCYLPGRPLQEPVMAVKVTVRREHLSALMRELRRREALIEEECLRRWVFIVRARAPLALLLGLGNRLASLTDGTAAFAMRLSHYAPVPRHG